METNRSLSIIIPVYNEIQLVKPSVQTIDAFARSCVSDYEILLIESGSTDGSAKACDELQDELSRVKVIHEGARKGFGSALRLGYKTASKDVMWLVTVDLPFPLDSLAAAWPLLNDYDAVLSYRVSDNRGIKRKIMSVGYNTIMKTILGLKVRHINSAFKLIKREVVQNLPLTSNGWFLDAEVQYWLQRKNIRTTEIPVPLVERTAGRSTISVTTPVAMIWEALRFVCSRKRSER